MKSLSQCTYENSGYDLEVTWPGMYTRMLLDENYNVEASSCHLYHVSSAI